MLRLGAILRLLMLAACLVPFTSAQQALGALAPVLPVVPMLGDGPFAPMNEENEEDDEERETPNGKEKARHASHTRHHPPIHELIATLPPAHASHQTHLTRPRTTPPVAADPFRNGLGTPYRC